MKAFARRCLTGAALLALLVTVAPAPSHATSETIKRSFQNMLFAPLDLALSPYVATKALITNWRDSDDTPAVKIAYPVFGLLWLTGVEVGASMLRGLAGVIELLPGLILIATDADLKPIYVLPEDREALVDQETPLLNVRFGVDYVSPGY